MEQDSTYINVRNISKDTTPRPVLLSNQKLDACQNDRAIERQRADHLNRSLVRNIEMTNSLYNTVRNLSVLLSNQKLDACQNDRAIEQQRADHLNRTLVRNIERTNMLCNTFRNLSESLCPRGWKAHNQKCYNFSADKRNWNTAKHQCESQNSHLIIINTPEEENSIVEFIKAKKEDYWIGVTDGAEEGKWKWVDGSTASYLNWQKDQPDNSQNNEDCVTISEDIRDGTFGWNDDNCGKDYPFICEKWALPQIDAADFEKFCS
ncbi:C-type lectin domain family 4 member E-like [Scyliorhinus canicula]|uniref:C-type lectin domain family 4 member E-like n=1 Tax=Scyliorhinus canicula TaxID=7830 RepID=UPI0018F3B705|nr:C-type lectin domain family 4 member E-like [Scyliorhinus canicula]